MSDTKKITADELDWEEPSQGRGIGGGYINPLCELIAGMRAALASRRGSWAVLDVCDKPTSASTRANALNKRQKSGDSRLIGLEFAARKMLDGGSKLYVRCAAAT